MVTTHPVHSPSDNGYEAMTVAWSLLILYMVTTHPVHSPSDNGYEAMTVAWSLLILYIAQVTMGTRL